MAKAEATCYFSVGKPLATQPLVPPSMLYTSVAPDAAAISEATAERWPMAQMKSTGPLAGRCCRGERKKVFNGTSLAPGTCPV